MIAKVVPAVRLPTKASETYDYNIPDAIAPAVMPGAVIIIPFAGRKIPGLVVSVAPTADHNKPLKDVIGFAQGLSPLPSYTVELWKNLAKKFATTLPRFVWMAMPTVPSRLIQTCCVASFETKQEKSEGEKHQPGSVYLNDPTDEFTMVKKVITAAKDRQVLILAPTIVEASSWSKTLGQATIYHSALATGAKYNLACATANGSARIVIGTKSAVFLPWSDLFAVIVLSSGSSSHLQEDSDPRFDARVVAEALATATGARLVAMDSLIPLGLTAIGSFGRWAELNAPRAITPHIHDLHDAAKAARSGVLLSESLNSSIDEAIAAEKRVLVILNRRGVSSAYVCQDCGTMVMCPGCNIPLTVHDDRESCPACERLYPLPENCDKCGSTNLKAIGFGSKTLFSLLKKRHPLARIMHIDRDAIGSRPDEAQIVVGTTAVFHALGSVFKPFDLAADALLGSGTGKAGIWSVEETGRILRSLNATLTKDGELHVQTFDQTAPALKAASDPVGFIKKEFTERQEFNYPPSSIMITIYGSGADESVLWKQAIDLVETLTHHAQHATVSAPMWSRPKVFRGKFRLTITLKVSQGANYDDLPRLLPPGFAAEVKML